MEFALASGEVLDHPIVAWAVLLDDADDEYFVAVDHMGNQHNPDLDAVRFVEPAHQPPENTRTTNRVPSAGGAP